MAALCDCDLTLDGLSIPAVDACVGHRKLKEALQDHFKYTTFRPQDNWKLYFQLCMAEMSSCACPLVESLCMFLVPLAVNKKAIGVIVSPLISLMDQQVSSQYASVTGLASR